MKFLNKNTPKGIRSTSVSNTNKPLEHIVTFLLSTSIFSIPTSGSISQAAILILFLIALFFLWDIEIWYRTKESFFQIFLFFFLAAVPLAIKSNEGEPLDVPSRYFIVSIIFLVLFRFKLPYHLIIKTVLFSIPLAFIASFYDEGYRLGLGVGIIEAGTVFSIYFFFLAAFMFYSKKITIKLISGILIFICIYLLIQTGSRGSWLATLVTSLVCGYFFYGKSNKPRYFGAIFISIFALTISYYNSSMIEKRTNSFISDIQKLSSFSFKSSTGQRIAVWELSINGFLQSPIDGSSYDEIAKLRNSYQKESGIRLSGSNDGRASSHNDILNIMLKQGSIGLIALLLIYLVPLVHFYKKYKSTVYSSVKMYSIIGITVINSIFISGITEAILMHGAIATLYAILLTILYHAIRQEETLTEAKKVNALNNHHL